MEMKTPNPENQQPPVVYEVGDPTGPFIAPVLEREARFLSEIQGAKRFVLISGEIGITVGNMKAVEKLKFTIDGL